MDRWSRSASRGRKAASGARQSSCVRAVKIRLPAAAGVCLLDLVDRTRAAVAQGQPRPATWRAAGPCGHHRHRSGPGRLAPMHIDRGELHSAAFARHADKSFEDFDVHRLQRGLCPQPQARHPFGPRRHGASTVDARGGRDGQGQQFADGDVNTRTTDSNGTMVNPCRRINDTCAIGLSTSGRGRHDREHRHDCTTPDQPTHSTDQPR
jgi:hypothetical protein